MKLVKHFVLIDLLNNALDALVEPETIFGRKISTGDHHDRNVAILGTTADLIEASETTSRARVSMPWAAREVILAGSRAVAMTRSPRLWKAMARAAPRPPSEQPVIKTVRGIVGVL